MSLDSLDSMQIIDDRVLWYDYDGVLWTEDASAAEAQEEIRAEVSKRLGFEVILLCVSDGNGHMVWRWQKSRVQDAAEAHKWLLLLGLDLSGVADAQVLRVARAVELGEAWLRLERKERWGLLDQLRREIGELQRLAERDEAVAEARREAAGEIARLRAELLEQGRELERWKQADAAALRERLGVLTDAAQRLLGVAMSHKSIPREMAAPVGAFDELRRALTAPGEPAAQSRPSLLGAWPGNETAEEVIAVIDGQTTQCHRCGKPASGVHTPDDLPICDVCFAVAYGQTKEDKPHG